MKRLIYSILACLLSIQMGYAQEKSVVNCQYWIDSGDRQEIAISGEQVAFVLDASEASEGMHTLNYRVKDSEGMYSPLQTWIFMKNAIKDMTIVNITASMEYWFDDKSNIIQTYMSFDDTISFSIDATPLKPGLHTLNYRVKDILGNHSCMYTWAFFKTEPKASKISWYKYWWNNNEDRAVKDYIEDGGAEYVFSKELTVPAYAMTDGYSFNSVARFHIVFGDDVGNISNTEWIDVTYPDVIPPISSIEADKESVVGSVILKWKANEDFIDTYNIYYSENDQPFVLWMPNTTKESATFKGQAGSTYRFTVTARDKSGNRERFDESKNVKVVFKSN